MCVYIECNGVAAVAALHKSERNKSTELFPESTKWITASHRAQKNSFGHTEIPPGVAEQRKNV